MPWAPCHRHIAPPPPPPPNSPALIVPTGSCTEKEWDGLPRGGCTGRCTHWPADERDTSYTPASVDLSPLQNSDPGLCAPKPPRSGRQRPAFHERGLCCLILVSFEVSPRKKSSYCLIFSREGLFQPKATGQESGNHPTAPAWKHGAGRTVILGRVACSEEHPERPLPICRYATQEKGKWKEHLH